MWKGANVSLSATLNCTLFNASTILGQFRSDESYERQQNPCSIVDWVDLSERIESHNLGIEQEDTTDLRGFWR